MSGDCPERVMVRVTKVSIERRRTVALRSAAVSALREPAVFLGTIHSPCLPTSEFPGLRPSRIYFAFDRCPFSGDLGWDGVRIYDILNRTLEDVFPSAYPGREHTGKFQTLPEVWITPNL